MSWLSDAWDGVKKAANKIGDFFERANELKAENQKVMQEVQFQTAKKTIEQISQIAFTADEPLDKDKNAILNHVSRVSVSTPSIMLDGGIWLGKVGFSETMITYESVKPAIFNSYIDVDAYKLTTKQGAEINLDGWLGVGVGLSDVGYIFVAAQVTPWIHAEVSLGLDGVGVTLGVDNNDEEIPTSYDFELQLGWLSIGLIVAAVCGVFESLIFLLGEIARTGTPVLG